MFSIPQEQGGTESPPSSLESVSHPQHSISGVKSNLFTLLQDSLQFEADTLIMVYDTQDFLLSL